MQAPVTAYTTKEIPEGMWIHWKRLVPRERPLGSRSIRLYAADVACKQQHGHGLIEMAMREGLIDEEDIEDALELPPPDDTYE